MQEGTEPKGEEPEGTIGPDVRGSESTESREITEPAGDKEQNSDSLGADGESREENEEALRSARSAYATEFKREVSRSLDDTKEGVSRAIEKTNETGREILQKAENMSKSLNGPHLDNLYFCCEMTRAKGDAPEKEIFETLASCHIAYGARLKFEMEHPRVNTNIENLEIHLKRTLAVAKIYQKAASLSE